MAKHDENTCNNPCHTRGAEGSVRRRKATIVQDDEDDQVQVDRVMGDSSTASTEEQRKYYSNFSKYLQKLSDIFHCHFLLP